MQLLEICQALGGTLSGSSVSIETLTTPDCPKANAIAVAGSDKLYTQAINHSMAAIVTTADLVDESIATPHILVEDCKQALTILLNLFAPPTKKSAGIHPSAIIGEHSKVAATCHVGPKVVIGDACLIEDNVIIEAGVIIGDHVSIKANSHLYPNVTIYDNSKLGQAVTVHAGSVIGSDGFGYHFANGHHQKKMHIGHVVIEDNVEIGANTTIDRGTIGETRIGEGSKIDNLVQIAHNVTIGKHCIICAFTGIAGSTTIGNYVTLAANVGVSDYVVIEDQVTLAARTGIPSKKKLARGTTWFGSPGRPYQKAVEQLAVMQRLPAMRNQLKTLQHEFKELKQHYHKEQSDE